MKELIEFKVLKQSPYADLEQHGDWIDLNFCGIHPSQANIFKDYYIETKEDELYYNFPQGVYTILNLGVSIKLPDDFEAHLLPRSSLFIKKGILVGNSMGIIDNSYCGNEDVWGLVSYFTRPTVLKLGERIAQFRIVKRMSVLYDIKIDYVDDLNTQTRGGFGSSGE